MGFHFGATRRTRPGCLAIFLSGTVVLSTVVGPSRVVEAEFPQIGLGPGQPRRNRRPHRHHQRGRRIRSTVHHGSAGTIHVLDNGNLQPEPFLDLSSKLVPERARL